MEPDVSCKFLLCAPLQIQHGVQHAVVIAQSPAMLLPCSMHPVKCIVCSEKLTLLRFKISSEV